MRRLAAAEGAVVAGRAFEAYGRRIPAVEEFRYLGRVLTATDDDWPAVAGTLVRARKTWGGDWLESWEGRGRTRRCHGCFTSP